MKIAVVILNWNGVEHLQKYLPSVLENSKIEACKIIVADNGSTDNSVSFIRTNFPTIEILLLDKNYGFAGGYNEALAQVDAELFVLLNSDVRVTPNWIPPVVELFNQQPEIAAIQPKILSDRDPSRFEHAGAAGGFIDKYGYPFCRGRIMNAIEFDNGQYAETSDILWASGACLFIRSSVFTNSGGFDASYFAHMEEIDLCWRLKNQGHRIVYCPESVIYHWGGATLDYDNPHKLFLNFRNSLWTLYKNYTGSDFYFTLFKRLIIDGFASVKFLVTLKFRNLNAIIRAHFAFYCSLKEYKKKRVELQQKTVVGNHPEILNKSIVWRFFAHSEKQFNQLRMFR